jgi:hypothetical protein
MRGYEFFLNFVIKFEFSSSYLKFCVLLLRLDRYRLLAGPRNRYRSNNRSTKTDRYRSTDRKINRCIDYFGTGTGAPTPSIIFPQKITIDWCTKLIIAADIFNAHSGQCQHLELGTYVVYSLSGHSTSDGTFAHMEHSQESSKDKKYIPEKMSHFWRRIFFHVET